MNVKVRIDGIEKLQKALDGDLRKAMRTATLEIARQVHQLVWPYPAESQANVKGQRRWYERGFGPKWHSDPARRPKKLKGHIPPIVYGPNWAGYPSSENLEHSWGIQRRGWGAIVGSKASYAPAVHHYKEQMKKHGQRGWKTDKWAVEQTIRSGAVDRIVQQAVKAQLK